MTAVRPPCTRRVARPGDRPGDRQVEFHDERKRGTRPILAATGAPHNFSRLLRFVRASAAPDCKVDISDLDTEAT